VPIKIPRRHRRGLDTLKFQILDSLESQLFYNCVIFLGLTLYGFSVMQEPVQHGAGQRTVVVEDFGPVLKSSCYPR
jgi:hypothetical protein